MENLATLGHFPTGLGLAAAASWCLLQMGALRLPVLPATPHVLPLVHTILSAPTWRL